MLKIWLNKLYYDLNPDYLNPMQEFLNNNLEYTGTISDLITQFTAKYRRDNVLLTDVINLCHTRYISDLLCFYDLLELMTDAI